MSVSSLPEWKQLLLERKRREEEERDRREREEEDRLASMPAWKRGIIQRRRAKQEVGAGERDRDGGYQAVDAGDAESYILTQSGGEMTITLEPERTQYELLPIKTFGRVSMENIGPIRQNPFIKSQSGWRKNRELEKGVDVQDNSTDAERGGGRGHDKEMVRGREIDIKTERQRDRSEGRERDRSVGRESGKDRSGERDRDSVRIAAKEVQKDTDTTLFPLVPGLRTIKAENIIIIEKDRRGSEREDKMIEKVVERERERQEEEEEKEEEGRGGGGGEKRGMRMDLRDFLAGGGSVTEIRATEVLIIKPAGVDDRVTAVKMAARGVERVDQGEAEGQEVSGRDRRASCEDMAEDERERPREASRAPDQERGREKAGVKEPAVWPRPQAQAGVQREEREVSSGPSPGPSSNTSSSESSGLSERGSRVSQLLSRFGEHPKHPKPPSRSKSSECFVRLSRERERSGKGGGGDDLSGGEEGPGDEAERGAMRGVPKRSFSFSDRVITAKENGLLEDGYLDRKAVERTFSDRRTGDRPERGTKPKVLLRWRHADKQAKPAAEADVKTERPAERQSETDREVKRPENDVITGEKNNSPKEGPAGLVVKMTQDEGFTTASVRNTEGIAFARKVSIRQEGKERTTEKEIKLSDNATDRASEMLAERITETDITERDMERDRMIEREKEWERQIELQIEEKKQSSAWRAEAESKPPQCTCVHSTEHAVYAPRSPSRVLSAATDLSNVPRSPTVKEADLGGRSDWESAELDDPLLTQTVLSQHTEELISKIGKDRVRDKKSDREIRRRTQTCVYADSDGQDVQNADIYSLEDELVIDSIVQSPYDGYSGRVYKEEQPALKSPKRGIPDEIQIPRTVFYGVDMVPDRPRARLPSTEGPEGGGSGRGGDGEAAGKGVERRESWKAGRPLTRVESLREKIRQRELEKQRAREAGAADGESEDPDAAERDAGKERWRDAAQERAAEERRKMGWEMEGGEEGGGEERETTTVTVADEWRQEEPLLLTASPFDVTQELGVSRASPQLPVSLSLSQPLAAAEEQDDRSLYVAAARTAYSDRTEDVEVEELTQHVVDLTAEQVWRHRDTDRPQGTRGVGDERGGGDELPDEDYLPPSQSSSPTSSLSPSPPLPHSLAAMSRIYNLKTVGSRSGLCVSERPVEVLAHKPLPHEDYRPFRPKATPEAAPCQQVEVASKAEHPWESSDEPLSVLSVQRQVEQLRLREQEVRRQVVPNERSTFGEKEVKAPQGQRREETQQQQLRPGDGQTRDLTSPTGPRTPTPPAIRAQPRLNQSKTFSGPSPENSRKHLERPTAPVPPSSPASLSPSPSPSPTLTPSPSVSPSPPLISIRSASSAPGKRGTTITITPRKPAVAAAAASPTSPSSSTSTSTSTSASKPAGQPKTPAPNGTGEGGKKRYPTAEEIQVIGGYQNLEKSCLVKSRGTSNKGVKVCFDEAQLERVCEYPSENSMLASFPPSPLLGSDPGREERGKGQEEEEEEEEERGGGGGINRNVGSGVGRVLRVDESCRR